ncbi:Mobile element protein [Azospirillum endophyticum]
MVPTQLTTDKLRSYGAAFREIGLTAHHEQGRRKNNRAEVSHQPLRRRERKMQRFKRRFPELFLADGPAGNWLICRQFSVLLAQRGRHETDSCGLGGEDH